MFDPNISPQDDNDEEEENRKESLRKHEMALAQFEQGPLGAREGWQPSEAWEKRKKQYQGGMLSLAEVAAMLYCRIHVGIVQTEPADILLHITFENDLDEPLNADLRLPGGERRILDYLRIYDADGVNIDVMSLHRLEQGSIHSIYRSYHYPITINDFHTFTFRGGKRQGQDDHWYLAARLETGKTYTYQVDYFGLTSNRFSWTVPSGP